MLVVQDEQVRIERLVVGPYRTNAYLCKCLDTGASVLVDAPDESDRLAAALAGTPLQVLLLTHNHMDHVGALEALSRSLQVPVAAHRDDAGALPVKVDQVLADGDRIPFGKAWIRVLHTPGHTPGSLCFLAGKYLLAGDTLFPGGPGHTESPARFQQILASIAGKLLPLPDHTLVFPGHGEGTSMGRERPAIHKFLDRPHDPELCGDVLWASS